MRKYLRTEWRNDTIVLIPCLQVQIGLSAVVGIRRSLRSVGVWLAEGYASSSEVVRGELYGHCVSWDETDEMLLHLATHICSDDHMRELLWELYLEDSSRERLQDLTFHLDFIVF